MLRTLLVMLAVAAAECLSAPVATAESRLALVIGNSTYQNVPELTNPANDAKAVNSILASAGFDVTLALDLNQADMRRAVHDFSAKVARSGADNVALIFYAGHGLQMDGESYLVPIDARIEREADVAIEAMRLSDVTNAFDAVPSRMRIVILDACRANPFAAGASIPGHGLAIVDAPTGSIVAYSTAPGTEALDGSGADSPYTTALLEVIKEPDLQVERLFKQVRLRVHDSTDGRQIPWESSSLTSDFAFFATTGPAVANAREDETHTGVPAVTVPRSGSGQAGATAAGQPGAIEPGPEPLSSSKLRTRARLEDIRVGPAAAAYRIAIEEDSVELYEEFLKIYPTDPLAARVRDVLAERLELLAWYRAVTVNTVAGFEAFLLRYPASDYAVVAKRLRERARQRGINPVTAAAFAPSGPGAPAPGQAPAQGAAPAAPGNATPVVQTSIAVLSPPAPSAGPTCPCPGTVPVRLEPPAIHDHPKKGGRETHDGGHKQKPGRETSNRHHNGPGPDPGDDEPIPAHPTPDAGGPPPGPLMGMGIGIGPWHGWRGGGWRGHPVRPGPLRGGGYPGRQGPPTQRLD